MKRIEHIRRFVARVDALACRIAGREVAGVVEIEDPARERAVLSGEEPELARRARDLCAVLIAEVVAGRDREGASAPRQTSDMRVGTLSAERRAAPAVSRWLRARRTAPIPSIRAG
ncbi:MAG: hypothetical protein ACYS0K_14565 [Planctomycetota bacterium]